MSSGLNHSKTERVRDCKRSLEVLGPVCFLWTKHGLLGVVDCTWGFWTLSKSRHAGGLLPITVGYRPGSGCNPKLAYYLLTREYLPGGIVGQKRSKGGITACYTSQKATIPPLPVTSVGETEAVLWPSFFSFPVES